MVIAAEPGVGIPKALHPPRGPLSDAAAVPRTSISTAAKAFALRMGGISEEEPTQDSVPQQRDVPSQSPPPLPAENVTPQIRHQPGDTRDGACAGAQPTPPSTSSAAQRKSDAQGCRRASTTEDCVQLCRQRCLSYDASITSGHHRGTGSSTGTLQRHSMSNIPDPNLPFPATRQQKQAAITALKKPLQVVTKEKSLIRCVLVPVMHACCRRVNTTRKHILVRKLAVHKIGPW